MKRALIVLALLLTGCTDTEDVMHVGDTLDGQIVFQVNEDGSFLTAPDVPCKYEDGADQELPCVWRADRRGNLKGSSVIIMPDGEGDRYIIRFDEEASWTRSSR